MDGLMLGRHQIGSASCRIVEAMGVPEHMREGLRELIDLTASNPRKGHATALMTKICAEADRARITLLLTAKPFQDGMTDAQLRDWYARFGFQQIQDEPILMARQVQIVRH